MADSYVTLAEADEWISTHILDDSWSSVSEDIRKVALVQASDHIDACRLRGRKYSSTQTREFPRVSDSARFGSADDMWGELELSDYPAEVPQEIRDACCLEAVAIVLEYLHPDMKERRRLQLQNVSDVSYASTRESYRPAPHRPLISFDAYMRMRNWIASSFSTEP